MVTERIRRVGLTGGIATGKSYVRSRFEQLGVPTIDADLLSREAVAPGTRELDEVAQRFGRHVLRDDGSLDRARLASVVFADPDARRALEAIIHPYVQRRTDEWFAGLDPHRHVYAVADIPLLYEVGRDKAFDRVIVVACSQETQLRRIVDRGFTLVEARARLAAQMPLEDKIARADVVIRTDGAFDDTDRQVRAADTLMRRGV